MRQEPQLLEMQSEERPVELQSETAMNPRATPKRVLVVDDEARIADTLTAIFRNAGYEAVAAYDGSSALAQCESFRPDLVITDVVMPGMTGIEMAIQVKQLYPTCKILLFSGQLATANLLDDTRKSGHDFELLTKPVHPAELLAKLCT
ncbi:MAG: response regulator [Candidatus Korobacteraceae bacterium]